MNLQEALELPQGTNRVIKTTEYDKWSTSIGERVRYQNRIFEYSYNGWWEIPIKDIKRDRKLAIYHELKHTLRNVSNLLDDLIQLEKL